MESKKIEWVETVSKEHVEIDILKWAIDTCKNEPEKERLKTELVQLETAKFKELERLKDLQHIENIKALEQPAPKQEQVGLYKYDRDMILRVYDFCINTRIFDIEIDEFIKCVRIGNFSSIKPLKKAKTKLYVLIGTLANKSNIDKDNKFKWYSSIVNHWGIEKDLCTNRDISKEWVDDLEATIKNKPLKIRALKNG